MASCLGLNTFPCQDGRRDSLGFWITFVSSFVLCLILRAEAAGALHPLAQMKAELNFNKDSMSMVIHVQLEDLYWFEELDMDSEDTVAVSDLESAADLHIDRLLARIRFFSAEGQLLKGEFDCFDFPTLDVDRIKNEDLNKFLMQYRFVFSKISSPVLYVVHDIGVEQEVPADIELELSYSGKQFAENVIIQPLLSAAIPTSPESLPEWPALSNQLQIFVDVVAERISLRVCLPSPLLYLWSGARRADPDRVTAKELQLAKNRLSRIISRNIILECDGVSLTTAAPVLQWLDRYRGTPSIHADFLDLHSTRAELKLDFSYPSGLKKARLAIMLIRPPVDRIPLSITSLGLRKDHVLSYAKRIVDFALILPAPEAASTPEAALATQPEKQPPSMKKGAAQESARSVMTTAQDDGARAMLFLGILTVAIAVAIFWVLKRRIGLS